MVATEKRATRFWAKVPNRQDGECWEWRGAIGGKGGHGQVRQNCKLHYAHRVSYEMANGPLPETVLVRHTCDNPRCVNPAHLVTGTQVDNMADMVARGRSSRGSSRPLAKLTEDQVAAIRLTPAVPLRILARQYGVAISTVSQARSGARWRHVATPPNR